MLAIFYSKLQLIMSAPNDTNNTNSNEMANQNNGGVEQIILGDTASTGSSTSASPGTPGIEDASVAPPTGWSKRVIRRGSSPGQRPSLFQARDYVCLLIGRPQKHDQILVSPIAANPQAGEARVAYHMTVPARYQDLTLMRENFHLRGKFRVSALSLREAYLSRDVRQ